MLDGTIRNARLHVKAAAVVGLILAVAVAVRAQSRDEPFEEKLRKASEAQSKKNQADEVEQRRLAAAFAAKREAMQRQEEAERRQRELGFRAKIAKLEQEHISRQHELRTYLKDNEDRLAKAVADLHGQMRAKEAESEREFKQERKEFSRKLQAKIAEELAKAEAERERQKQIAMMAAMTYFTGGAAIPAVAASGINSNLPSATNRAAAQAVRTAKKTSGKPPSVEPRAKLPASQTNANFARSGLFANADRRAHSSVPSIEDEAIYPTWGILEIIPGERVATGLFNLASKVPGISRAMRGTYRLPATTPIGRRTPLQSSADLAPHNPQMKIPTGKPLNISEAIGGRLYTAHALDRMSGRGLAPSIVENTIKIGEKSAGKTPGTLKFFDPRNKVGVVIDTATGKVITVE